MTNRLVIFGNRVYAEIVWDYFSRDSDYEVVGFTVDADYISETTFCGLPVVPFEEVEKYFSTGGKPYAHRDRLRGSEPPT